MAEFDGEPRGSLDQMAGATGHDDIVVEARDRFSICIEADDRADALEDLYFLNGQQWDGDAARQRELDSRPTLTINNVPAILHQVTNDARQNKQSVQVAPVDGDGDPEVATIIEGIIRHIEYDSDADAAYDTALDGAARIGFGYFRLVTEYESPMSFNQVIKIKRIRNPFTVQIDPNAQEADGHDMGYGFISSKIPFDEFVRQYPKASTSGEGIGTATGDDGIWGSKEWVRVGEYYRVEHTPDTLVMLPNGQPMLKSDEGFKVAMDAALLGSTSLSPMQERATTVRKVMWYKITGAEVLEKQEIPFDWIPIFPVYGDEIDIDGVVVRNGIIRNLKDPKRMENYWLTSATEEIAMRTKTPFVGALGQFEGLEQDWNDANVRNFSYLEYNPVSIDGTLTPPPQRQPPADVPTGFIAMAQIAGEKVKSVTGIYDASLGNRSNEVSGLAIKARQQQGDIANFHFADNLTRAITRMAKCIISGIPRIYDAQRVVRMLGQDRKTVEYAEVNTPKKGTNEQGQAIETILNDLTVGTYDVTVSTGPAYNTLRQESVANMIEIGGKWAPLMDVAGDKVVSAMDWPAAQEISERIKKFIELKTPGLIEKDEDDETPPQVMTPKGPISIEEAGQMIGQLDQAMEQMQNEMEKLESGITKAEMDNASRERIADKNNEAKLDVEELKGMVTLLTNQLAPIIAHQAAVVAAADDEHPDAPAPIAQGIEQAPAAVEAQEAAATEEPA